MKILTIKRLDATGKGKGKRIMHACWNKPHSPGAHNTLVQQDPKTRWKSSKFYA